MATDDSVLMRVRGNESRSGEGGMPLEVGKAAQMLTAADFHFITFFAKTRPKSADYCSRKTSETA